MSRTYTSWPSSAKQAAVTRPTHPAPMTPMGSRESFIRRGRLRQRVQAEGSLAERLAVPRDREHVVLGDRLQQRVGDPVARVLRLPRDEPNALAVLVDHELPPVVVHDLGRALEDRRGLSPRPPHAVVIPRQRGFGGHHSGAPPPGPRPAAKTVGGAGGDPE